MHRIGRTGRVGRSGRAITFYEPRQERDIEAIEEHTGVRLAPWTKGAHVATEAVESTAKRHSKPHDVPERGEPARKLLIAGGWADEITPADVVHVLASGAGLGGEAVHNVVVLEHFSLADVPATEIDGVIERAPKLKLGSHRLKLEPAL